MVLWEGMEMVWHSSEPWYQLPSPPAVGKDPEKGEEKEDV